MDLALLVYGISVLHNLGGFLAGAIIFSGLCVGFFWLWYVTETDRKHYYTQLENDQREANGKMCVKWMKRGLITAISCGILLVFLPSQKTAYVMVGAYAAQKVAENEKVQVLSGKVLTIIEQKLDDYIDEGIAEVEKKATKRK